MKKRLIITTHGMLWRSLRDAGVSDDELLLLTSPGVTHLADPDAYLHDDVPLNSCGRKLWRAQDLPIIPTHWKRVPCDEQRLADAIAAIQGADKIIHAGEDNLEGQRAVDELLKSAGRDPGEIPRCPMPGPADAGRDEDERSRIVLEALNDPRQNRCECLDAAADAFEKADWLASVNLTRAYSIANQRLISITRWNVPIAAYVAAAGGRTLEADVVNELDARGSDDVEGAVMSGLVRRERRRGAPWETHAPTRWRDLGARHYDVVLTPSGQRLLGALGADHTLRWPPRDAEILGAIGAGVLRAADWLREEEDFVREQVAEARALRNIA